MKHFLYTFSAAVLTFCLSTVLFAQNQGSQIETLDTATGKITVIRKFDYRVEAPEWTPDGKWIYFNSRGKIYKMQPDGSEPILINTGSLKDCNNDHTISPDGKTLAVSAGDGGKGSRIYTLPVEGCPVGSEPSRATERGPSYLHGWSPDGQKLVFTGQRDVNDFDIYSVLPDGTQETRLTTESGLDDGPEYSRDGKHVWFNSVRSGLMQIWRINADGTEPTQMTKEDAQCWFPHMSPDGKQVVYLAYEKDDVKPSEHPANKNVRLCLMSIEGTASKTLVDLFGGQGTINVNSWSPDNRTIAYVRYEKP